MRHLLVVTWVTLLLISSGFCQSVGEPQTEARLHLAVLDFATDSEDIDEPERIALTDWFTVELLNTGIFNVRDQDEVRRQRDLLKDTDKNCITSDCAVLTGKAMSCQKVIVANIGRVGKTHTVQIKSIDVESNSIEFTLQRSKKGDIDNLLPMMKLFALEIAERYAPDSVKHVFRSEIEHRSEKLPGYKVGVSATLFRPDQTTYSGHFFFIQYSKSIGASYFIDISLSFSEDFGMGGTSSEDVRGDVGDIFSGRARPLSLWHEF